jgi:parvulin-like peptidyl-prolyl isomerase
MRPHASSPTPRTSLPPILAVLSLAVLLNGCGSDDTTAVIAEISGEPVQLSQFDKYVERTLTEGPGEKGDAPSPELLSRLLDRFIDEELIVREAIRRGMGVSEAEIAGELQRLRSPEGTTDSTLDEALARESARRALLLHKFRAEQLLKEISVSDEEITSYYEEHRSRFMHSAGLVLRQILLDDESEARRLRKELWEDPSKFQEVAEERSLAPDGGRPAAYDEANLPPEVLESVGAVKEGQVSRVCKSPEGVRIFLVVKREAAREVGMEEASDRIRVILLQEKSRKVYEDLLIALRSRAGVVIREENVPFPYMKRASG